MRTTIQAIAGAALLLAPALSSAGERITRSLDVSGQSDVHVINAKGDITVVGHGKNRIDIEAVLGKNVDRLDVVERGDRVTIEVVYKRGWSKNKGHADVFVYVPQESHLEVEGVSSDIDVENVRGALHIRTVSGDIDSTTFGGDVEISTTSGDIEVEGDGSTGDACISTVSGDLSITGISGGLKASTVSGDVDIEDGRISDLTTTTTSGSIDVMSALTDDADIDATTISGDVDVMLASQWGGRIDVNTLNGSIDNCFGPKAQRTSRYGPGRTLTFDHAAGKARLEVETVSGDVDLCVD
ncbi:MAG: DUF4097 family beta strand repeat-containing protein [Pseudomonadota bacterium]